MNMLDYAMLGVLGISALAGLRRGLVAEALILAGWLVSFVLARSLAGPVGQWLPLALPGDQARWLLGFVAVMAAGWLGFFLLRQALAGVLRVTGLSGVDRVFGLAFGLAAVVAACEGDSAPPVQRAALAGLLAGLAGTVRKELLLLLPALGMFLIWRRCPGRALSAWTGAAVLPVQKPSLPIR